MTRLLLLCLVLAAASAAATPSGAHCGSFARTTSVSAPFTIAEIERQEMAQLPVKLKIRSDYPKVPFGFINPEWVAFKSQFRRGDHIVRFTTDQHSWLHLAGRDGYTLVRAGCVVATFTTMMN